MEINNPNLGWTEDEMVERGSEGPCVEERTRSICRPREFRIGQQRTFGRTVV